MNNHYIPCLLLKQFAASKKVNTYDFTTSSFTTKKLKNTFSDKDIFDADLEKAFAEKLEGPFGNLLNHKLLCGDTITIDRRENMLMRRFLMINCLRAPIISGSWDEMVERAKLWKHQVYTVRISENSFVGKNQSKQEGQTGPDTADRLFNLIEKKFTY